MHGPHYFKARKVLVRDFAALENFRKDADDFRPAFEGRVSNRAHQAYVRAAVHQAEAGGGDGRAQSDGLSSVGRMISIG